MNILVPDSWLREFLETDATPQDLKDCLSLCGPSIERINKTGGDYVYDIEITSNRVDMASVYGIAREVAAILPNFGFKAKLKEFKTENPVKPIDVLPITITDENHLCKRVLGVVMEVDKPKPSSDLIKYRLESCGVRSLNNLVDITNYVMLEIGHPCHVFDYDRIKTHKLIIRNAKPKEEIITLDEKKYLLNTEDIIIDDGTGRIIDLPGIMGTENSVVNSETKRILFFIESNNAMSIRKSSMRYGIRTMAATINEKNPDPELAKTALLYGISLYRKSANGAVKSELIDIYPKIAEIKPVNISVDFINQRLGIVLEQKDIEDKLKSLNFAVKSVKDMLTVTPPTYRQFDVLIPEDIVEEVARIYGYHNLPNNLMTGAIPVTKKPKALHVEEKVKTLLKHTGLTETYSYSMLSDELMKKTGITKENIIKIANPLTEELINMRTSLVPQMLNNLAINQKIHDKISLFELSKVYLYRKNDLPNEKSMLCIGLLNKSFFELKGIAELLLNEQGITNYIFSPIAEITDVLNPKLSAKIECGNKKIGFIGMVKNHIKNDFGITADVALANLDFDLIAELSTTAKKYIQIRQYPPLIQDLSLIFAENIYIQPVVDEIKNSDKLVSDAYLIDSFANSRTVRIVYQDNSRTLSENDIKPVREQLLKTLEEKFRAKLKQ